MTTTTRTHVEHPASGLRLGVPIGWAVLNEDVPVVLASPLESRQSSRFRANVVVTVEQPPAALADLTAYTQSSIDGMRRMLTGFQVIAIDDVALGDYAGHRVLCGYRSGIFALAAEYWLTVARGVGTTLTASCQVEDYLDLVQVFEEMAGQIVPAARVPFPGGDR